MAVLDTTVVNVALSAMQASFHTDVNTIQWVVTGYFLAQAAVIPIAGYCSNRYGAKRMFVVALVLFTLGSLICGLSPNILSANGGDALVIACRVFQGIGGGMLVPIGSAIGFGAFKPEERAAASSVVAVPVLLAPTLGPTLGGAIVDSPLNWPGIFFINIPLGILAIILALRILDPDENEQGERRHRFDVLGLALSMAGSILIVYAFTLVSQTRPGSVTAQTPNGQIWGWGYWLVWVLAAAGVLLLVAFGFYETHGHADPVLELRTFRSRPFAVSTVVTWLVRATIFGAIFLIPIFLEQFRGKSAIYTGLALMPQGLGGAIGVATSAKLYNRFGPRAVVVLGCVLLTASSFMLIGLNDQSDALSLLPALVVRGLGFGWSNIPLQTLALQTITGRLLAKASSLYNATAQIFSSIGVALISTLFIENTTSHASSLVATARSAGAAPAANLPILAAAGGASDTFRMMAIFSIVVTVAALTLPSRPPTELMGDEISAEGAAATPRGMPAIAEA